MTLYLFSLLLPSLALAQTLTLIDYDQLSGWGTASHSGAATSLLSHCNARSTPHSSRDTHLTDGYDAAKWNRICQASRIWKAKRYQTASLRQAAAKELFETHFSPMRATLSQGSEGFLTGYFIPEHEARFAPDHIFRYPVYAMPPPMANQIALTRTVIESGGLRGMGLELVWMKDPVDLFFLQIQGSGFIRLPDGTRKQLAYAGTNDLPYTSIGKIVIQGGYIEKDALNYETLRHWLKANPALAREIMQKNHRYVFFTLKEATYVKGAANVALTANHSLAIDPAFLPYGLPVFLSRNTDTARYNGKELPAHFFTITGDTGAAIKGPLRGDMYFGAGKLAEKRAGALQHPAQWVILVPK